MTNDRDIYKEVKYTIRNMKQEYTELVDTVSDLKSAIAELRTEIRWMKALMVPLAVGSAIAALKVLMG